MTHNDDEPLMMQALKSIDAHNWRTVIHKEVKLLETMRWQNIARWLENEMVLLTKLVLARKQDKFSAVDK